MNVKVIKINTNADNFMPDFEKVKGAVLSIIKNSIRVYYGDEYQIQRICEGCILYLAEVDSQIVGVSYVKSNCRRGITAVFPENYRRLGIAEKLIAESFNDFPSQFTILRFENEKMISLLEKMGFKKAQSIEEIRNIVGEEEFELLSDFQFIGNSILFKRTSKKRGEERTDITLLYIQKN